MGCHDFLCSGSLHHFALAFFNASVHNINYTVPPICRWINFYILIPRPSLTPGQLLNIACKKREGRGNTIGEFCSSSSWVTDDWDPCNNIIMIREWILCTRGQLAVPQWFASCHKACHAKCTIFCEPGNRTKSRTAAGYSSWDNQYHGAFPPPLNNMNPQIIILYRSLWSITCSSSSHQVLWYILVPGMTSFIHWLHIKSTDTRKWRTHSMTELLYRRDRITVFTCISLSN